MNVVQNQTEANAFNIREFLSIFVRWWPIVCGVPVLALLAGMTIFFSLTPRYTATASILIDPKTPGSIGPGSDFGAVILVDSAKVAGIASTIQSNALLERVVESEKLYDDPEFGAVRQGPLAQLWSMLPGHSSADQKELDEAARKRLRIDAASERLQMATSVTRDGLTYLINVAVNSSDPVKTARLAQAVSEAYINNQLQAKYDAAHHTTAWLEDRLAEMRKQLIRSEEAVAEVRQKYGLTAIDGGGISTVASQQVNDLNVAIGVAETELSRKQAKVEQARHVRQSGGNIESLPEVMASVEITALRGQQFEITRKLAQFRAIGTILPNAPRHPEVIRLEEELRAIEGLISAEVDRIIANQENDYAASRNYVTALKEQLKKLTGAGGVVNTDGQVKLREAQSVADANRQSYGSLLNKFNDLEQSETMQQPEGRITENARVPKNPSFPRLPIFVLGSFGPGLLLGLGGAFAANYFRSGRLQSSAFVIPTQIEETFGLPVLASVPLLNVGDIEREGGRFDILQYLVADQFSHFAEALRCIRFGLRRTDGNTTTKVIQIVSAVPGEGKSTLAASLALSSALAGARVVLIDCDFRRPMTTKLFRLTKTGGLSDLLSGRAEWDDVANNYSHSPLTVVPVGNCDQSSIDLIGSPRMIDVLKFASQHYDLVFLDSPPLLPASDAAVISSIAEKTILLIEWNKTDRDLVRQAINRVKLNKGALAGIILNKVDLGAIRTYGYNYSKYFTEVEKYYDCDHPAMSRLGNTSIPGAAANEEHDRGGVKGSLCRVD
jgi:succinoglycan biosynthesis transport protein ExoP